MPNNYIKSIAKKTGRSIDSLEHNWDQAKAAAAREGRKNDYPYITGIFQKIAKVPKAEDFEDSNPYWDNNWQLDKLKSSYLAEHRLHFPKYEDFKLSVEGLVNKYDDMQALKHRNNIVLYYQKHPIGVWDILSKTGYLDLPKEITEEIIWDNGVTIEPNGMDYELSTGLQQGMKDWYFDNDAYERDMQSVSQRKYADNPDLAKELIPTPSQYTLESVEGVTTGNISNPAPAIVPQRRRKMKLKESFEQICISENIRFDKRKPISKKSINNFLESYKDYKKFNNIYKENKLGDLLLELEYYKKEKENAT